MGPLSWDLGLDARLVPRRGFATWVVTLVGMPMVCNGLTLSIISNGPARCWDHFLGGFPGREYSL